MLDAIKGFTGNNKAQQKQQNDDLQSLIAAAKEERERTQRHADANLDAQFEAVADGEVARAGR